MRSIGGGAENGLAAYKLAADTPAAAGNLAAASTVRGAGWLRLAAGTKEHTIHLLSA